MYERYLPSGNMYQLLLEGQAHPAQRYVGKKIVAADLMNDGDPSYLWLLFDDGSAIRVSDSGQSCCESRYISTDDDIGDLVGHKLTYVQVKDGPECDDEYDCHETAFVEIGTDQGSITLVTHNEHNGYYGGFSLVIDEVEK